MGKVLIIKDADFSETGFSICGIDVPDTPDVPDVPIEDIVLTKSVVEENKLLNVTLKVGDTLSYQPNAVNTYTVWGVPVEYATDTYQLVTTTRFGPATSAANNDYCVFAVVLDDSDVVLDVILAHGNNSTAITDDTYEIDMSKYDNPAKLYFNNNKDVTVTVLLG